MSHDAIENMPSEPPTPTISSVGSELSFEAVTPPVGVRPAGHPQEHQELFLRDEMVTIQVEETLFRIPSYFLTQDSPHFADFFTNIDMKDVVHIFDNDVSSSAFANLLIVLRPRLGVTPISTLSEWTDVLHLSTKWDFQHLRTAAITAIRPLASAVDKLVLGRAYGFTDWVPSAYTDLLARTDDLTVAEARRMDIEDVVAIAQGRREARTQSVRPMKEIEEIARTLSSGPTEAAAPAQAPTTQDKEADRAKMSPWVGDLSSSFAQESLVRFMQEDRRRVPLALDMILESGLEQTTRDVDDHVITDGSYRFYLNLMHARDTSLQLVGSPEVEDACLRLVNHWQAFSLKHIDLTLSMHDLVNTSSWNSTVRAVQYLAYLCRPYSTESHLGCVVSPSIFSGFWDTLTALHREVPFEDQLTLALCMHTLMESVGRLAFSTYVRVENDTFYSVVEKMRAEVGNMAGSIYGRDLYQALKKLVEARRRTK